MKKTTLAALLFAAAIGGVLVGCAKKEKSGYKIGFIQLIDNATFKEMRDGFYERLAELGYGPDKAAIIYKDAQGDTGTLNAIAQEFANGGYDMVVTLATPATQAYVNLEATTPNIFISVADPVGARIVSALDKPDKNSTGTSNYIPADRIVELADKLTPGIKTYGFIYNFGEPNAVGTIVKAKQYLDSKGIQYIESTVSNSGEVQQAAESLVGRVDAIFIPNDSLVVSAMLQITAIASARRIPVYGTALVHVMSGGLATVGIDDRLIGRRSAEMAVDYLKGKKIADTSMVTFDTLYTVINSTTASTLGVSIPAEFKDATLIK